MKTIRPIEHKRIKEEIFGSYFDDLSKRVEGLEQRVKNLEVLIEKVSRNFISVENGTKKKSASSHKQLQSGRVKKS